MKQTSHLMRLVVGVVVSASLIFTPVQAQRKQLLEYPSIHSPVVGQSGMVVTQNATASKVGADILAQGGNAVDAGKSCSKWRG